MGLLTQKQGNIKLTPRHRCSSASVYLPIQELWSEFPISSTPFYPPHFKSPPLRVAVTWLSGSWPKSAAPRASQSDVSLLCHGEPFSFLNRKTCMQLTGTQPPPKSHPEKNEEARGKKGVHQPLPCHGVGIKLPSATHPPLLSAAAEASCQTPPNQKTFVLRYKKQWLTAAHVVSSVVNLSSARYCLHMATRPS